MNTKTIMALVVLSGLSTAAIADVEIFENTDPAWNISITGGCAFSCGMYRPLDVTSSSEDQVLAVDNGFGANAPANSFSVVANSFSGGLQFYSMNSGPNMGIAGDLITVTVPQEGGVLAAQGIAFTENDPIDSSYNYLYNSVFSVHYDWSGPSYVTQIGPGEKIILGVSIDLEEGTHYGFVELLGLDELVELGNNRVAAVRWGYETAPGIPFVFPAEQCGIADFEPDGELNFFDVSAFLSAFTAMDAAADLNDDGDWNFFDVSDFLSAFSAGCP